MENARRLFVSVTLLFCLVVNVLPCGPGYVTPVFESDHGPENPFENFAAGNLGIIKPEFHRSVLYAAYRYINGGGFLPDEQKALVDVWKADFDNKDYQDVDVTDAVNAWIDKRQEVLGKEEKTPDIYTERNYSGYNFFPNCTKNAFETATETLSDRSAAHGPSDPGVVSWVKGQDEVFANCASGKQKPDAAPAGAPNWLQKDRAYQIAAASFYSMYYDDAKHRFDEIAHDFDSPWQDTADYLVARTLMRQASLSKDQEKTEQLYNEAEQRLAKFTAGKFADSAERMVGLIKYRLHPKERVGELGRKLMSQGGSNFRQDLIDYTWLMDNFESGVLNAEEKRKEDENRSNEANTSMFFNRPITAGGTPTDSANTAANISRNGQQKVKDDDIEIRLYSENFEENWTFYVRRDATDDDAIVEAERVIGHPIDAAMKDKVREARRTGYAESFSGSQRSSGHSVYYGSEKITLSLLPDYLRSDELTEWLYLYPIQNNEAYLYSLSKYSGTNSDLWLMTALSKADKNSTQLMQLLVAADRVNRNSPAYQTIAYHHARLLIDLGKNTDAKKLLDNVLADRADLTISARNQLMGLRLKLADSMDDFLKYSLRKPFAFDFDGEVGTIDELIAQEKTYYDPKNNENKTQDEYDRDVEDRYKNELSWKDRTMFDGETVAMLNDHFPLSALMDVERSAAIPDYMRDRFAVAIWTRAALLDDYSTAAKISPELVRFHPELADFLSSVNTAATPVAKNNAILFLMLKNPIVNPDIQDGMGRASSDDSESDGEDSGYFQFDVWWCSPYEDEDSGDRVLNKSTPVPAFLTAVQKQELQTEKAKIKVIGDAPKYFGEKVLAWAKRSPLDKRIPESLFIAYRANGWTKYSCGNNEELHDTLGKYLKLHFPQNEWTRKVLNDEKSDQ